MYYCFIVHSSADEHLCCFHFLTSVNSAGIDMDKQADLGEDAEFFWLYA